MTSLIEKIYDYMDQENDKRLSNYPLMDRHAIQILVISFSYLIFVKKLGPKFMESRKPYELKRLMQIYNILQVILNLYLAIDIFNYLISDSTYNFVCAMPDYSRTERGYKEAHLSYFYFSLKVLDLMDTIFITLRKRYRQSSILHIYHHMIMCLAGQILVQNYPGGSYLIPFMLNCLVHVIMYFYYFLTSIQPQLKESIWWKKHITQIQMIQFCYNLIHFGKIAYNELCQYSKFWTWFGFTQNFIFFILFGNFYIRNYILVSSKNKKKH